MRFLALSFLVAAVLTATVPAAGTDEESTPGLGGLVRSADGPLGSARVYAYQVTELTLTRATTSRDGHFLFRTLPAGVYRIIAHKIGFVPAVVLFTRATQSAADFLEFDLTEEQAASFSDTEDFWSIRRRIPGDVLREIELAEALENGDDAALGNQIGGLAFETEMTAGLDDNVSAGPSQITHGRIGMQGRVGGLLLELDGRFDQLKSESQPGSADLLAEGRTDSLDVSLANVGNSAVRFQTVRHTLDDPMRARPVDFERYQVQWQADLPSGAESNLSAQYFEESGFHSQGLVTPAGLPEGSRTLRVDGTYRQEIGERLAVRTGLGFQEMLLDSEIGRTLPGLTRQRVNAFGIGSTELTSGVVVEYGLYSTLLDGTFAIAPHGGVVVNLGNDWQAEAVARQRFRSETPGLGAFAVAYFRDPDADPGSNEHYYRVGLKRSSEDGESIQLSATHRKIGDTLRIFFTEDFFDQIESVYLVQGDELPEVRLSLSRRLAPRVLTTLESNVGAGGGGLLLTSDNVAYENQVRYAVTSLDTQFQQTSTGVFVALHYVEQRLDPIDLSHRGTDVDLEKLQIKLTQALDYFFDLGTEWTVLLNVELSRGDLVYGRALADDLHRRVAGGVAVRF